MTYNSICESERGSWETLTTHHPVTKGVSQLDFSSNDKQERGLAHRVPPLGRWGSIPFLLCLLTVAANKDLTLSAAYEKIVTEWVSEGEETRSWTVLGALQSSITCEKRLDNVIRIWDNIIKELREWSPRAVTQWLVRERKPLSGVTQRLFKPKGETLVLQQPFI